MMRDRRETTKKKDGSIMVAAMVSNSLVGSVILLWYMCG